jgi:hypothetical protein
VSLDGGTLAIFEVYSGAPLTFTLATPSGQVIDPSLAASDPAITYTIQGDAGWWWYQYQVSIPTVGTWQNTLQTNSAVDFAIRNLTNSTVKLYSRTDHFTYRPGDLVTLEAVLADGTTPLMGVTITGTLIQPDDSTLNLSFYDDGTHGDTTASDGVHTTQFNAASMNGHPTIDLEATKGNTTRVLETNIAVAAQTAQFQEVTDESPIDLDGNSLYDWLNLDVQLNVLTSGHFEVSGVLVDGNGDVVASGTFATLLTGSDPLPVGLQTIVLPFAGESIRVHGVDGPYTLESVVVHDQTDGDFEVDSIDPAYTTAAYQFRQFEGALLSVVGGSESTADTDLNGRYDELTISLNMEVVWPGNYEWNGRLVGASGTEIGWATASGYLDDLNPLELTFDGEMIGASKLNGPYTLRDLSVYQTSGGSASTLLSVAYTTQNYSFTDFEGGFYNIYLPLLMRSYGNGTCSTVPTLLGPADGSSLSTLIPLFQWDSGNDPNTTALRLQVAQDPDFTQSVWSLWSSGGTGVGEFRFSSNLDPATTYYWRAWLMCDDTEGPYSDVWSFTTGSGGTILSVPTLIAPANGSTLPSLPVTLQWSAVDGAVEYLIHWRKVGQGGYCYSWGTETQREISWLDANTSYEWWVSARNDYAIGTNSETWQFITPVGSSSASPQSLNRHFVVESDSVTIVSEEQETR